MLRELSVNRLTLQLLHPILLLVIMIVLRSRRHDPDPTSGGPVDALGRSAATVSSSLVEHSLPDGHRALLDVHDDTYLALPMMVVNDDLTRVGFLNSL